MRAPQSGQAGGLAKGITLPVAMALLSRKANIEQRLLQKKEFTKAAIGSDPHKLSQLAWYCRRTSRA
jgi:hypothetical protein